MAAKVDDTLLTYEKLHEDSERCMTRDEVEAILGAPRSFGQRANAQKVYGWHLDQDQKHRIEVSFEKGVVSSKSSTMDFGTSIAAASNSTLAGHFAQLAAGMTEDQVTQIMGKPTDSQARQRRALRMVWILTPTPAEPASSKTPAKKPAKESRESKPSNPSKSTEREVFALVFFVNGKATDLDCSEVPPKNHDLTLANEHRIRGDDRPRCGAGTRSAGGNQAAWERRNPHLAEGKRRGAGRPYGGGRQD